MAGQIIDLNNERLRRSGEDPDYLFSLDVYADRLVEITGWNSTDVRPDHVRLLGYADALEAAARLMRSSAADLEAGK